MSNNQKVILGSIILGAIAVLGIVLTYNNDKATVTWDQSQITSPAVQVQVIKKITTDPNQYELVRVLASSTPNNGVFEYWPVAEDYTGETYLEVGCTETFLACQAISPYPL